MCTNFFPRSRTRIRARTRAIYGGWVSLWSSHCLNATLVFASARTPSETQPSIAVRARVKQSIFFFQNLSPFPGFEQLIRRLTINARFR